MIVNVRLCDADSTDAREAEERRFGLDGQDYVIDLCSVHAPELEATFARWIAHARKVRRSERRNSQQRAQTRAVRAWAVAQGIPLEEKGRIPQEVWTQYAGFKAAQGQ